MRDFSWTPTHLSFALSKLYPFTDINRNDENRAVLGALSPSSKSSNLRVVSGLMITPNVTTNLELLISLDFLMISGKTTH